MLSSSRRFLFRAGPCDHRIVPAWCEHLERRRLLAGSISGRVYVDATLNHVYEPPVGDTPMASVVVFIDKDLDKVLDPDEISATTGADGTYALTGLTDGSKTVRE